MGKWQSKRGAPVIYDSNLCWNGEEGCGLFVCELFDLTPCAHHNALFAVAVLGILLGLGMLTKLSRSRARVADPLNWQVAIRISTLMILVFAIGTECFLLPQDDGLGVISQQQAALFAMSLSFLTFVAVEISQHQRYRVRSAVQIFWLCNTIALTLRTRSKFIRGGISLGKIDDVLALLSLVTIWVGLSLECFDFGDKSKPTIWSYRFGEVCPSETASLISRWSFNWLSPLLKHGARECLKRHDLGHLARSDLSATTAEKFLHRWNQQLANKHPSLFRALCSSFWRPYLEAACLRLLIDIPTFAQPMLLHLLISFIESRQSTNSLPLAHGFGIAGTMFVTSVVQIAVKHQYFHRAKITGIRVRSALAVAIYKKAMSLTSESRASFSSGEIVNRTTVDLQRIEISVGEAMMAISSLYQIIISIILLHFTVGKGTAASLPALFVAAAFLFSISAFIKRLQKQRMQFSDLRLKTTNEMLMNIKGLKLHEWTEHFLQILIDIRNQLELRTLRKWGNTIATVEAICAFLPSFVLVLTFAASSTTQVIDAATVFPAVVLFNILQWPLMNGPQIGAKVIEAFSSLERIQVFLCSDETREQDDSSPGVSVESLQAAYINQAKFSWQRTEPGFTLDIPWFNARPGSFICITGSVGSGKSAFLQALLGNMHQWCGERVLGRSVAFVSQKAWVTNESIRDNILFGKKFEPEFYRKTIHACCLAQDFLSLPSGDQTRIGDGSVSLSGGQKARVALARAVYSRADVYLLDDCLAAVDNNVAAQLLSSVLGKEGLLKGKTRIVVSNNALVKDHSDSQMAIDNGCMRFGDSIALVPGERTEEYTTNPEVTGTSMRKGSEVSNSSRLNEQGSTGQDKTETLQDIRQEQSQQGNVGWGTYTAYAKANSRTALGIALAFAASSQALLTAGSLWLQRWSDTNTASHSNVRVGFNMFVYGLFALMASFFLLAQNATLLSFCAVRASRRLHRSLAHSVFMAPMSFFESTPTGRVINRFSNDMLTVDQTIPAAFNELITYLGRLCSTLFIILWGLPMFGVLVVPLLWLYVRFQRYHLRTSRELKRLQSLSAGEALSFLKDTIAGVATIRSHQQQGRFVSGYQRRIDDVSRANSLYVCSERWLALRLELIGSVMILFTAGLTILSLSYGKMLSAGVCGLMMSCVLQITVVLNYAVQSTTVVESSIISVERILEYSDLNKEGSQCAVSRSVPAAWPTEGTIQFRQYSTRYQSAPGLILKNLNISIKARERVGIVGRSGAGKSSLLLALFRTLEATTGTIEIDGIDISKIHLSELRTRLCVIPQDPIVFEGTIRSNLDPMQIHDDTEIWTALCHARLKPVVDSLPGGLDAYIAEDGSNLSQGQRQLISLARAILSRARILVLDEATASLDMQTDRYIQETLRSDLFSNHTIVAIAHRLESVMDYDRILVMDGGEVAEFDTPQNLIERRGMFWELLAHSR